MTDNIAAVLALVQGQDVDTVEAEIPVPPIGASVRAQEVWYQTLKDVEFENVSEWRLLEAIVEVITQYDRVKAEWESDGSEVTSKGSMQQDIEHPALGTMQKLRAQEAALWKQLALPTSANENTRRPGRPTRANANPNSKGWGTL